MNSTYVNIIFTFSPSATDLPYVSRRKRLKNIALSLSIVILTILGVYIRNTILPYGVSSFLQLQQHVKEVSEAFADESYSENIWNLLRSAIQEIQRKNNSGLSFEELYRNAYTLVLQRKGDKLYNGLTEVITQHLVDSVRKEILQSLHSNFLHTLNNEWVDHQTAMIMIRDILMYMDRVYIIQNNLDNVYNLGLILFRENVIRHPEIRENIRIVLLDMIHRERKGEVIDRSSIKNICNMLMVLGIDSRNVYQEDFETFFLDESRKFYKSESQRLLSDNNASDYIYKVESRLTEETERLNYYTDKITKDLVINILQEELLLKHMKTIIEMENSGVIHIIKNQKTKDLNCMYNLFSRVKNGISTIICAISAYLRDQGRMIVLEENNKSVKDFKKNDDEEMDSSNSVCEQKNPIDYIESIIKLKEEFDIYLVDAFNNNHTFKNMIAYDFEYFINLNSRSPEYLSSFIHNLFKKAGNGNECGCQFTAKLEGMFKDMSVSQTLNADFQNSPQSSSDVSQMGSVDLSVQVLTTGFWPTPAMNQGCVLPSSALKAFNAYKKFYLSKHSGRTLSLQGNLGTADLLSVFYGIKSENGTSPSSSSNNTSSQCNSSQVLLPQNARKHIISVSTHQMCILMLFNDKCVWTFQEILKNTEIPEKDLKRALQSLALGKSTQRILLKSPKSKDILLAKTESEPERKETRHRVDEERRHEIEASIVRIMKARRLASHSILVSEVIQQLSHRFNPAPASIKKCIEALIEREFLSRTESDMKSYTYVV